MRLRFVTFTLALAATALGALALAGQASAFIYWADSFENNVSRANLDGTGADLDYIDAQSAVCGVAVDATYVYWAVGGGPADTIGRAKLDGTEVDPDFITGAADPCGVAIDDSHIYWANFQGASLGRANLDGTGVNQSFVSGISNPCDVTVTPTAIYWTNSAAIGRAAIDGTNVNAALIPGVNAECGAIDANSAHIYFAGSTTSVGRANLDGSALDTSFITGTGPITCGVAVDDRHVYWGGFGGGSSIGRANLDGSAPNHSFIPNAGNSCGLTTDGLVRPTTTALDCSPFRVAAMQPATCTATVTDASPVDPRTPTGTVSFVSSDSTGAITPVPSCTLAAGGASPPGTASCSVKYTGQRSANLRATYGGRTDAYASSEGLGATAVSSFLVGATTLNRKQGTATIAVTAPGPGIVALNGPGVKADSETLDASGLTTLGITPARQPRKKLRKDGEVTVKFNVAFLPLGGGQQASVNETVELKRKFRKKNR